MLVEDLPPIFLRVMAFVFGSLWGSFFNVAIYRWPREMSVVSPPSHCPACGAPVPAWRNVPILNYALSRGRAACCGAKLTPRYLLVELLCGVLALALMERLALSTPEAELAPRLIEVALYFVFVGGLVVATFTDLEWMMIPDEVTLPGAALGLATVGQRDGDIEAMAIGAGLGYLVVQVLFVWSYERLTGRRGMGEGDAKLLLFIGAFVGWQGVLFAIAAGSLQGIVVAAVALATRKPMAPDEFAADDGPGNLDGEEPPARCVDLGGEVSPTDVPPPEPKDSGETPPEPALRLRLPFGPFLAVAALEWLFFGDRVLEWYLGFFDAG
ncbi:MAG: prepilin peptidase [Sandaracinus sp.]|nr:prepilin peptidase [Sandaracinus sp.]